MEYSAAKLVLETLHTYGELNVYCDGHGCRHVFLADPDDPRTVLLVQAEEVPPLYELTARNVLNRCY